MGSEEDEEDIEEDIIEQLIQRAEQLDQAWRIWEKAFLISGPVAIALGLFVMFTNPNSVTPLFVLALAPSAIAMVSFVRLMVLDHEKIEGMVTRVRLAREKLAHLRVLKRTNPELVRLNEYRKLEDGEKAQAESRRSFWVNIAINLVFTLLGFALSYMATKMGWLR